MSSTYHSYTSLAASKIFHFPGYFIFLRKDGIIQLQMEDDFHGTIADAKNMVTVMKDISQTKKHPVLVVYGKYNTFEQGVREYIASDEVSGVSKADALVIEGLGLRVLGNAYLKMNKPARPSRLFNEVQEALKWLEQFRD